MIFLDFSGTIFASFHADIKGGESPNKEFIRHLCMNTIRHYNKTFRHEFGEMVICYDSRSWRERVFPEYKWVRKNKRKEDDGINWDEVWEIFTEIQSDISKYLPYRTVEALGAEADDTIAVLTKASKEKVLVISNDKDLVSLTGGMVHMFRPYCKEMFTVEDPVRFEFDLIVSGDKDDGIPSIKCPDGFLKCNELTKQGGGVASRAPAISKKLKDSLWAAKLNGTLESALNELGETVKRNYLRNMTLIALDKVPEDVVNNIMIAYSGSKLNGEMKLIKYLQSNRMHVLGKHTDDFRPAKIQPSLF